MTCSKCGMLGHLSNDPKCPQYGVPSNQPCVNAQRLIEHDDDEAVDARDLDGDTPLAEVKSHYSNSWGGSQYEPDDDDDRIVDHDSNADGAEAAPDGEDDDGDEIRMSTMHIQMNAMRITRSLADTKSNWPRPDASDEGNGMSFMHSTPHPRNLHRVHGSTYLI